MHLGESGGSVGMDSVKFLFCITFTKRFLFVFYRC